MSQIYTPLTDERVEVIMAVTPMSDLFLLAAEVREVAESRVLIQRVEAEIGSMERSGIDYVIRAAELLRAALAAGETGGAA